MGFGPTMFLILAAVVALAFPNSQEIVDGIGAEARPFGLRWRPTLAWAACVSGFLLFTMTQLSHVSAFLYFQF